MSYENDNIEENLPLTNYEEQNALENNFNLANDSLINTVVDNVQNISGEKVENDNFKNPSQNLETNSPESAIQHSSNSSLISIPVQVFI